MKVILTDNYDRDHVADEPYREGLTESEARDIVVEYNNRGNSNYWAIMVQDDYRLKRGVEDMI